MRMTRIVVGMLAVLATAANAFAAPVTFAQLTGLAGGVLAGTGVYKADLSGLGLATIASITIQDASAGVGGAAGQFSGFDLDGIKLSTTDCATAACASGAASLVVFDFTSLSTFFTPGVQRAPADPKLFGTGPAGNTVGNAVATLGLFDGESTTAIPGAFGFISMGDGGLLAFNLTSNVSTTGLFLYIGEVGDNGEVAAGSITVSDQLVTPVPEPATLALLTLGLLGIGAVHRRRVRR